MRVGGPTLALGLAHVFGVDPGSAGPPRASSAPDGAGSKVGIRGGLSSLPSLHPGVRTTLKVWEGRTGGFKGAGSPQLLGYSHSVISELLLLSKGSGEAPQSQWRFSIKANGGFPPKPRGGFPSKPREGFPSKPREGFPTKSREGFPSKPRGDFLSKSLEAELG